HLLHHVSTLRDMTAPHAAGLQKYWRSLIVLVPLHPRRRSHEGEFEDEEENADDWKSRDDDIFCNRAPNSPVILHKQRVVRFSAKQQTPT
ncbi:MAG: hypothetical protein ABI992_04045, partial [Chthoniobacterales bacterium]